MFEWGIEVEEYIVSIHPHNDRSTRVCVPSDMHVGCSLAGGHFYIHF